MTDIVERLRFHPADEDEVYNLFNEAADEIERLRKQLSRQEWYDSADRHLMQEEIDQLRKDVQNLNKDCMMLAGNKT